MSAAVLAGTVLVIAPIVIRNYLVFPDFTPTGGTIGINLWEGLGETELGRQHGFLFGDDKMIEHERVKMGRPADCRLRCNGRMAFDATANARASRSRLSGNIRSGICGVMLGRMWGMLKVAGDPVPYCRHQRHQRHQQKVFAAAMARRCAGVRRERVGNDSERHAISFSAVRGVWNLCRRAQEIGV